MLDRLCWQCCSVSVHGLWTVYSHRVRWAFVAQKLYDNLTCTPHCFLIECPGLCNSCYRLLQITLEGDIAELLASEAAMQTFKDEFKVSLH